MEWRFYSDVDEGWLTEWEEDQGRPRFIELNLAFVEGRDPIRTVFWLPPVVNARDVIAGVIRANQLTGQQGAEGQEGQENPIPQDGQPPGSSSGQPLPGGQGQSPSQNQNLNGNQLER